MGRASHVEKGRRGSDRDVAGDPRERRARAREGQRECAERAASVYLRAAGCDLITITQYLRPSPRHHPVERWVKPEEFVELSQEANDVGFLGVMSGPLVRSSYRAGRLYQQALEKRAQSSVITNG